MPVKIQDFHLHLRESVCVICKCGKDGCTEIMFHPVMPGSTTPYHSNGGIYYADTMQSNFLIYNTIHYTLKVNTTTHTPPRMHTLQAHTRTPHTPTPHTCFCYSMSYVGTSNFLNLKHNVFTFNFLLSFL